MVPTLSIVGCVLVVIFLLMTLVAYAGLNQSQNAEYNIMLYILMAGLSLGVIICFLRINKILTDSRRNFTVSRNIRFETCPNYWVRSTVVSGTKNQLVCTNTQDNKQFVGPFDARNVKTSFNVEETLNKKPNREKCELAKNYAWSEAYAKCDS